MSWSAETHFQNLNVSYAQGERKVACSVSRDVLLEGSNEHFGLNGNLAFEKLSVQYPMARVNSGSGAFAFHGDLNDLEISDGGLKLFKVKTPYAALGVMDEISAGFTGVVDIADRKLKTLSAELFLGKAGPIHVLASSLDPLQVEMKADGVKINEAVHFVKIAEAELKDWQMDGSLDLSMQIAPNQPPHGSLSLKLASLSDPSGRYLAEKLEAQASITSRSPRSSKENTIDLTLNIPQGEALFDKFYVDFSSTPLRVLLNLTQGPDSLLVKQGELDLKNGFSTTFSSIDTSLLPLKMEGSLPDLKGFLETFLKPSFAVLYPALNEIETGGSCSWDLALSSQRIEGRINLKVDELSESNGLELKSLAADIPILYPLKESAAEPQKEYFGDIRIEKLQAGWFRLNNQDFRFRFTKGGYYFDPIRIPLADGILTLNNVTGDNPFSEAPIFSFTMGMRGVQLQQLNLLPKPYELSGLIDSAGVRFRGSQDRIESSGDVAIALFDGRALISDIAIESPFSLLRRFLCNLDFKDFDLEQLTNALSFGRITGTLDGYVHNLSIAYGQPETFDLKVWSVPKKGVPQKVSFNAVNDIQTISSGAGPGPKLPFGIQAFIDELPYEKIGIACVLRNDVFRINGTVMKGGREHFVSRAGLIGLDVININPNNQISFKDMLERVKRVAEKREAQVE